MNRKILFFATNFMAIFPWKPSEVPPVSPPTPPPPPPPTSRPHLLIQPSTQAFSARSFLDSTMSCDVTERYSPSAPSQYCQIKYGGLSCQVAVTSAGSWKPVFGTGRVSIYMCMPKRQTTFRFLKYGSAKPSFVQLKRTFWTFTRSNLYQTIDELLSSICANESLHKEFRLRTAVETV